MSESIFCDNCGQSAPEVTTTVWFHVDSNRQVRTVRTLAAAALRLPLDFCSQGCIIAYFTDPVGAKTHSTPPPFATEVLGGNAYWQSRRVRKDETTRRLRESDLPNVTGQLPDETT